ncbi:hypothetical protein AU194_16175 [Mycobacterium sp. GA-2829]|nr:hypothetical protein AU194_16175 [Mycobacterium sp. GA-2829]
MAVALTGCTRTTEGSALAAEPGPLPPAEISIFELGGLLLDIDELEAATGLTSLRSTRKEVTKMWDDSPGAVNAQCIGALFPLQIRPYDDSDWNVVRGAMANDAQSPGAPHEHSVIQGVVRFAKSDAAQRYAESAATDWEDCGGETVITRNSTDQPTGWRLADFRRDGDTLTLTTSPLGEPGAGCLRALRAHSNVVIDAMVCGSDLDDQAAAITGAIADGMPQL